MCVCVRLRVCVVHTHCDVHKSHVVCCVDTHTHTLVHMCDMCESVCACVCVYMTLHTDVRTHTHIHTHTHTLLLCDTHTCVSVCASVRDAVMCDV